MSITLPFTVGTEYFRQALLDFTGSRQRFQGIIYGSAAPGYVICTSGGHNAEIFGYSDRPMTPPAHGWIYYGQGAGGDQDPNRGGNRLLTAAERTVLLFTARIPSWEEIKESGTAKKLFCYRGAFSVDGWDWFTPTHGPRRDERLLRYRLVPASQA